MAIKPLDSKQLWLGLLFGLLYGLLLILTTHSYGVAPDTPLGYFKGERIFQYLLSGNKKIVDSWGKKDDYTPYESVNHPRFAKAIPDFTPGKISTWYDNSLGYLPSAATCYLFYRKLNLADPVTAHKLSNIFFGAMMITLVFWFASEAAGALAGFFSSLSLALYPRLFILIQSNIKDVPMLSWYILTVWTGWRAVELDDWRWLLVSAGALGVGMGSKSTAGFAFLILLVYLLVRQIRLKKLPSRSLLLAFLVAPFLSYLFIYMSNPIYWPKTGSRPQPVEASSISPKTGSVSERVELSLVQYLLGELKRAASPRSQHSRWGTASLPGWTSIRARFAFFATPMITNILAFIGILVCLQKFYHNEYGYYLMLVIWFFVPLLRTAAPHTIVYGGIRLYVDYVPALCLLAGLGALQVTVWLKTSCQPLSRFAPYLVLAAFLPVTYKLIRLHPYESIYFNSLMGGNEGAMESMYPSTGDVNCTTYPQAVAWFNRHAESGAGIVTVNTHLLNGFGLRSDLRAVFRPEEVAARDNVYYLMVPVSWNYEEEIPWKKENRILVKEIRPDDSPVLLIYKHRKRE